ncbi:Multidrug resistance protein MdtH [Escherichia coli]|uniref:Multidrug resistance protein MdtH n=1 Tax=Escherichia coli TaxID=562 RepID=A0A376UDC5_ECOLX|nr:Multidrug resistance protein MdtH [Escherichia coli]
MLVVLGFFVVFPLISIRFVDQMGWAAVMVGIALGLRQFIQQGLGISAAQLPTALVPNR